MKAICVQSPNHIVIEDRPMPLLASPTDVMLKIRTGGICGSDVHVYHGRSPVATYPRVIGHEIAGEIVETGSAVTDFKIGDRVVMDPVIHCGECYQCRIGRRNVCAKLKVRSAHVDGGFQEYLVLPQQNIYHIPDQLSWEEAAMIEPFTIAEQVCSRAEISKEDIVFILGAGPVGLSILKRVKLAGATCFISDVFDSKLALALTFGADQAINAATMDVRDRILELTQGNGATVVIDAVCSVQSFEQAFRYVCAAGRVIPLGFNSEPSAITQLSIMSREIDVRGSRLHNNKFPIVIDHFASGRLKVLDMITHRFPFTAIHEALRVIEDPAVNNGKVMLHFNA
ncbi:MAG: zinc-binding alcohol dehydrogenase family protein [Chitinophagaceae bacterium]|nr:zinc-binding alcohol dehydrogenase family protein [Chitinophagaceae bacterium]